MNRVMFWVGTIVTVLFFASHPQIIEQIVSAISGAAKSVLP